MNAKVALATATKYTDTSIEGTTGPLAGKNCTIESIEDITGGHKVTFKWTADSGDVQRSTLAVMDGTDGQDGEKGDTGETGAQGPKGDKGDKGDTGEKGDKGDTGEKGEKGDKGETGSRGASGYGVPTGGTIGQVLAKRSGTDYDTQWVTGGGGGGAVNSVNGKIGDVELDAEDVGAYSTSEVDTALAGKVDTSSIGVNGGVATLDNSGKVPSAQLPSYVDDVLEGFLHEGRFYSDYQYTTELPSESGKIYTDLSTNKTYRWSGSTFVEISESLALGETSSTAFAGSRGKAVEDTVTAIKDGSSIDSFGDVESALANKADKVSSPTSGNFAALDSNGNLTDSGHKHSDYLTSHQDISGKQNVTLSSAIAGQTTVEGALGAVASGMISFPINPSDPSTLPNGAIWIETA